MTDPTGRSFLSYRRSRHAEAELLIRAQRDHGIPTWQDISNLEEGPTEDELRRVLADPSIACGILWITPEVCDSPIVRDVEAPAIVRRVRAGDSFFALPVAAGGLAYEEAAAVIGSGLTLEDLKTWNLRKETANPIGPSEAAALAFRILERRIVRIHQALPATDPLRVCLYTRVPPAIDTGVALTIDWSGRFAGREAAADVWRDRLLPALNAISLAIRKNAPGRKIAASGQCCLPAALALGRAFLEPGGLQIQWQQRSQSWSLSASRQPSGFASSIAAGDPTSEHLAVMVSVTADVETAMARSSSSLPAFRAHVRVSKAGASSHEIATAEEAVDVARIVAQAIRDARSQFPQIRGVHLFVAGPAGLAMLIGQLLNTLGPVQTYEHVQDDAVGVYHPAATIIDA